MIAQRIPDVAGALHARTLEGRFRPLRDCLLPGLVVPDDGSRDASIAIDLGFHANDRSVLREFGVTDRPRGGIQAG